MPADSLFRALGPAEKTVRIEFEGASFSVPAGISLAAALLLSGVTHTRDSAVSGRPGAPFCMMGVCFECLVEVDGLANCQACLLPVRAGMRVLRQRGARDLLDSGHDEEGADE
ncbi:putative molibdopterin-dependent oxidoreductase YjgC [Pseudomonas lini]|uniref:(2Fe-2S)-binding protein n=1 Tax=Pseudomonas lini TaxID=163011 RepID=UPI00277DAD6C|nr:(2Fe-2S)-binding protein [Pseudomonas lini]MDQ0123237.1 putative molibdopterin-dependent oxidoreductase YjgC [Pseudomonas lini]